MEETTKGGVASGRAPTESRGRRRSARRQSRPAFCSLRLTDTNTHDFTESLQASYRLAVGLFSLGLQRTVQRKQIQFSLKDLMSCFMTYKHHCLLSVSAWSVDNSAGLQFTSVRVNCPDYPVPQHKYVSRNSSPSWQQIKPVWNKLCGFSYVNIRLGFTF